MPLDKTGEKQQPITCSTVEMKLDGASLYNQASKVVSPSALVTADRSGALAFCAQQPVKPCEFHNDSVSNFVTGAAGLMFQAHVTASKGEIPSDSLISLFGKRADNLGFLEYTSANGVLRHGQYFEYVGYTEKGIALLSRRPPDKVASLN